ncbi:unnamed protein product, partial [Timema podura]|nr:unnamed protein product [Timema podura]
MKREWDTHASKRTRGTFQNLRSDQPNGRGGGTVVLIKNNIQVYSHHYHNLQNLEAAAVKVNTINGSILFAAIYKPPTKALLQQDLDTIIDSDTIFLAGDLNSKPPNWNSRLTTRDGRTLNEHADSNDYIVVGPGEPTLYPSNPLHRPGTIDVVLTSMRNNYVTDAALDFSKIWKIKNQLKSNKKQSVPAIHGEHGMAYTSSEKAEAIAIAIEKQFTPSDNSKDLDF